MAKQRTPKTAHKESALQSYTTLIRAAESVTARIHRQLDDVGLTLSQFGVLEALFHLGPQCQKDLAHKILKTSGNLTMVIDNLEKQSLVRRERDVSDRRIWKVSLTDKGRRMISQLLPKHTTLVAREMSVLKPSEQSTLAKLCNRLGPQAGA